MANQNRNRNANASASKIRYVSPREFYRRCLLFVTLISIFSINDMLDTRTRETNTAIVRMATVAFQHTAPVQLGRTSRNSILNPWLGTRIMDGDRDKIQRHDNMCLLAFAPKHSQLTSMEGDSSALDIPDLYDDAVQCGGGRDMITHVKYLDQSLMKLTGRGIYERMNISRPRDQESSREGESWAEEREFIYQSICKNERFVLISHGTESSPVYNFGNQACLHAFARSWDSLTVMPSKECVIRKSEDEKLRIELMQNVTDFGFVDGEYRGYRVRGDGKFIKLTECVVWNCYDDDGNYIGQAALFDRNVSPVVESTND